MHTDETTALLHSSDRKTNLHRAISSVPLPDDLQGIIISYAKRDVIVMERRPRSTSVLYCDSCCHTRDSETIYSPGRCLAYCLLSAFHCARSAWCFPLCPFFCCGRCIWTVCNLPSSDDNACMCCGLKCSSVVCGLHSLYDVTTKSCHKEGRTWDENSDCTRCTAFKRGLYVFELIQEPVVQVMT